MKGNSGIPALQLEVLNRVIELNTAAPSGYFGGLFPTFNNDSDKVKWEYIYGSGGITPFVAPGSPAPTVGVDGTGSASASAAYWKEKMYFDESFLNNLKKPGTQQTYELAEKTIARGVTKLSNRCLRRREWMMSKMFTAGGFTYKNSEGMAFTVDYGVPSTHKVTLATDYKWGTGTSRNPISDIMNGQTVLATDAGARATTGLLNTQLLNTLVLDSNIQTLLAKSQYGNGDLFARPAQVIGALLDLPLTVYDEYFELQAFLIQNAAIGATTLYLDDVTDFEVGGTIRLQNMKTPRVWEDRVITAVDVAAGTLTFATATTKALTAGRDRVIMRKKFIDDNTFCMFVTSVAGQPVAEFMAAPYGMDRRWGQFIDTKYEWDPDGVWVRVQDKGLPVYYNPDTTYTITVR
jgi:hypothetical protein